MKNLVILTGAGMSAESGISTFRDAGGLWDKYPVEQVATPEGYAANPQLVIDFYNERRKQLVEVKPNRGHELVADLEKLLMRGLLQKKTHFQTLFLLLKAARRCFIVMRLFVQTSTG